MIEHSLHKAITEEIQPIDFYERERMINAVVFPC